ncbi:MAG: hypothetical protein K6E47_01240 [Lachnospiraceae bacterium]|nr:hypothetical protein [Lachnospiraceae bacterium]
MKRSLKILFCLSILAFVIGIGNISAKAEEKYNVWIGSTQVTSSNKDNLLEGRAKYDPATKTLYCNDLQIKKTLYYGKTPSGAFVEASGDLCIAGVLNMPDDAENEYGIIVKGVLTLEGNITAYGKTAVYSGRGIYVNSGVVKAVGADHGIVSLRGGIIFNGGWVEASGHEEAVRYFGDEYNIIYNNGMTPYYLEDNGDYEIAYLYSDAEGGYIEDRGAASQDVIISSVIPEYYDVWIGDVQVTSGNKNRIEGKDGGYVSYDPAKKTLTFYDFNGVNFKLDESYKGYAVYSYDDLTIKGSAVILDRSFNVGIGSKGKLTVEGNFSITTFSRGLYSNTGIVILGEDTGIYTDIICEEGGCIYSEGTIEIEDGMVTCFSDGVDFPTGIYADNKLIISGGDIDIYIEYGDGIYGNDIEIKGGNIIAEGKNGIRSLGNISITGGDIELQGEYGAIEAYGELIISEDMIIAEPNDGKVVEKGECRTISADDENEAEYVRIVKGCLYPVWIENTRVTSENKDRINGRDGGYVSYDPDTKTLTFYDFQIDKREGYHEDYVVYSDSDLNIKGTAKIIDFSFNYGIYSRGKITVEGNFIIKTYLKALIGDKGIDILGEDTVINAHVSPSDDSGHCIYSGGTIEIKAGKISCSVYGLLFPYGICASNLIISGGEIDISAPGGGGLWGGTIEIKGGKIKVQGEDGLEGRNIIITGGEIEAQGDWAAIVAEDSITISKDMILVTPKNGKIGKIYERYNIIDSAGERAKDVKIIKNPITISTNPSDTAVEEGQLAYFEVKATGKNLKYLWQYKEKGKTTWTDWTTKTTPSISVAYNKKRDGMSLRCIITDASGYTATSGEAVLTYKAASSSTLTITEQPKDATVAEKELAYFGIKAKGEGLKYLWQYKEKGKTTWTDWTTKTTADISVAYAKSRNGMSLRCKVTDKNGKELISNAATLTYTNASGPSITEQPKNTSVKTGELAYFGVTAKGDGLTYLWQYKNAGSSTWTDWTSKKTASISVAYQASRNGMSLRCVVTDKKGNKVTSSAAVLTYTSASGPSITEHPKNATAVENGLAYFSVKATGSGLTYLWQYKNKGESTWTDWTSKKAASISVAYLASRNGMSLRCVVTDKNGNKVTSNAATLTYTTALKITTQPVNSTVNKNELAYFTVKAEGKGLTYLWQYKLAGDSTWTDWTSKKAASISVAYAAYRNNMQLRCVITDSNGNTVTSNVVTLKYNP